MNYLIEGNGIVIPVVEMGQGWLIVNKPAGLSIHNDPGRDLCSILSEYIGKNLELAEKLRFDKTFGVNAVHRLDRETSGIVLLGCDKKTVRWFAKQFEERCVKKKYIALVHGNIQINEGIWDIPLTPRAEGRKNPEGKGKKVACVTRYQILDRSLHYSLIECEPVTGRKHQIRRHAKLSRHPIVGDARYGSLRAVNYLQEQHSWERLGLHSFSLEIKLPLDESLVVFSSEVSPEIMQLLADDKKDS